MGIIENKIKNRARTFFGNFKYDLFFAPSRINLIGEHLDYNGGYVLPAAIDIGSYIAIRKNGTNKIRLRSLNAKVYRELEIGEDFNPKNNWLNYPLGMVNFLKKRGYNVEGFDGVIMGNIPTGSGLSSSASLEILIGYCMSELFNEGKIDNKILAEVGMDVENKFIGLNSGIMDQFAIAMGRKDKMILLDTSNLNFSYEDIDLDNNALMILNTKKHRKLTDSKYNERKAECDKSLEIINRTKNYKFLSEISIHEMDEVLNLLNEDRLVKRVRHIITENQRVLDFVKASREKDYVYMGSLLNESDKSLKDDYEVTGYELDTITSLARYFGALGARMTGAGFGGCAIALIKSKDRSYFKRALLTEYKNKTSLSGEIYEVVISDGPKRIIE